MSRSYRSKRIKNPFLWLLVFVFLMMTGCGAKPAEAEKEIDPQRSAYMIDAAKNLFGTIAEISGTESEEQARMVPILEKGLESYQIAEGDLGPVDMSSIREETVRATGDHTYEVEFLVDGRDHSATVSTLFEEGYNIETKEFYLDPTSITTNVNFSSGELIGQAGLNTILGMGTTFFVLILLSFIISLFKYINQAQQNLEAQKKSGEETVPEKLVVESLERLPEDADPSLIAAAAGALMASGSLDGNLSGQDLIAVIAAAVMASGEEEGLPPDRFVVRSIQKQKRNAAF